MGFPGRSISVQGARRPLAAGMAVLAAAVAAAWILQLWPGVGVAGPVAGTGKFDPAQARADLVEFIGDGAPRVAGTPAAAAGRERLAAILERLGLLVERQRTHLERRAGAVDLENLVVRLPGRSSGPAEIAVVAHSDSAPGAPGASDDGAGIACALAVARALLAEPPERDVLLLVTDGEERGLLGAQAFVAQHPAAKHLRAVVNMDARGASGPAFVFETGPETAWLSGLVHRWVPAPRTSSLMGVVYGAMPNGTDLTVFLRAGMTGFNIAFLGDMAAYHSALDTVERQSDASRDHMGRTALALVRALDAELPRDRPIPPDRAVFGDVLGQWVVRWPEAWTPWLAGVACAVLGILGCREAFAEGRASQAGRAVGRGAAVSLLAALAVLAFTAGLGFLFSLGLRWSGATMASAGARLQALDGALLAAAVLVAAGGGLLLGRRGTGPWSAVVGAWAPWAALACPAAVVLPAASFPLVVPVLAAGMGAAAAACAAALVGRARPTTVTPAIAGLAAAAFVWIPLAPPVVDALGFHFGWLNGLRAGMVAICLLPLACAAGREGRHQANGPRQDAEGQERDRLGSNQQPSVS